MSVALLLHGNEPVLCTALSFGARWRYRAFTRAFENVCLRVRVSLYEALAIVHTTGIEWQR